MNKKEGSMESKFAVLSDYKFLTEEVKVGSHAPGIQLLNKRYIFSLSKPCPFFFVLLG